MGLRTPWGWSLCRTHHHHTAEARAALAHTLFMRDMQPPPGLEGNPPTSPQHRHTEPWDLRPSAAQIIPVLRPLRCPQDRIAHPVPTGLRPGGHSTTAGYSSTFVSVALTLWGPWGARLLSQGEGGLGENGGGRAEPGRTPPQGELRRLLVAPHTRTPAWHSNALAWPVRGGGGGGWLCEGRAGDSSQGIWLKSLARTSSLGCVGEGGSPNSSLHIASNLSRMRPPEEGRGRQWPLGRAVPTPNAHTPTQVSGDPRLSSGLLQIPESFRATPMGVAQGLQDPSGGLQAEPSASEFEGDDPHGPCPRAGAWGLQDWRL